MATFETMFDIRTVSGVAAATLILVEGIKASLKGTKLDAVPLAVWILITSGGLTLLAQHMGVTAGQTWTSFFLSAALSALTSSGAFTWVKGKPFKTDGSDAPPSSGVPIAKIAILLMGVCLLFSGVGCAVGPRERAFHTGVKAGWDVIGPEYVKYVHADASLAEIDKQLRVGPKNSLVAEMNNLLSDEQKVISDGK